MKMFRQGDVLIEEVSRLPNEKKLEEVPREGGRVILAHGEVTGHAHALTDPSVVLMSLKVPVQARVGGTNNETEERYLKVGKVSTLRHEEHGPIDLPPGNYKVTIQRQWDQTRGWTNVID